MNIKGVEDGMGDDERAVKFVYPRAEAHKWGGFRDLEEGWTVCETPSRITALGGGSTEAEAWAAARAKLPAAAPEAKPEPPATEPTRETLEKAAARLPGSLTRDVDHVGVLRRWTTVLPLRHQGVLTTAIRGCDGAPKEDSSKSLSRMIRRAILNPADERETLNGGGFFGFKAEKLVEDVIAFLHSLDQYPLHYVMHMCHASEVIGYKHPENEFREFFAVVYQMMVYTFHLEPETEARMDHRLTLDRVAAGTTERNF